MVLEWIGLDAMRKHSESGISMIEVLLAAGVLAICSIGAIGLVSTSIATNTRNKFDSTTAMLAETIVEQINATLIGSGTASLTDCAGNTWSVDTAAGGAALNGTAIDFTQSSPPATYQMSYVVKSPCNANGIEQATYDVRWHVDLIGGSSSPTNTYLLTVGAQMLNRGQGNLYFASPVTIRMMSGN